MDKRFCVVLEDDVYKLLRLYQADLIKNNVSSCSFSKALNLALRKYFDKR